MEKMYWTSSDIQKLFLLDKRNKSDRRNLKCAMEKHMIFCKAQSEWMLEITTTASQSRNDTVLPVIAREPQATVAISSGQVRTSLLFVWHKVNGYLRLLRALPCARNDTMEGFLGFVGFNHG